MHLLALDTSTEYCSAAVRRDYDGQVFARQVLDGVIYQEVPQPSLARYDQPDPAAGYGYQGTMGVNMFASSGHLRVTVSATEVRVEYVRSVAATDETSTRRNGVVLHSYVVR